MPIAGSHLELTLFIVLPLPNIVVNGGAGTITDSTLVLAARPFDLELESIRGTSVHAMERLPADQAPHET
jgi:hypothetical protein